jgi:hypothetical protein
LLRLGAQRPLFAILSLFCATAALAQGGPPMVTDDPETPGDGNWEINLASIGQRNHGGWLFTALDADINYGWGDRLQLKIDTPWNVSREGGRWVNGSGTTLFGVKWRFYEDKGDNPAGWAVSTYPQLGWNLQLSSVARGLADPGKSFFLPVEATTHLGPIDIDLEAGRDFQQDAASQWIAGVILAHTFSSGLQMMFESREHWSGSGGETLLNVGSRWELFHGLTLLAAAGREVGAAQPERVSSLVYLGVQLVR